MRRILVVDDERDIRSLMRYSLERRGYRVETAEDGVAGLEAIRSFKPELVLLNIMMPRMDGLHMLQVLQQEPPAMLPRVVMSSASQSTAIFELSLSLGAVDFLHRPHSMETLMQVIREALDPTIDDHRRLDRARFRHAIDVVRWMDCAKSIEAVKQLPLGQLKPQQRLELRRLLLEAAQSDLKNRSNPKQSSGKGRKFQHVIDPALTVLAIANAL